MDAVVHQPAKGRHRFRTDGMRKNVHIHPGGVRKFGPATGGPEHQERLAAPKMVRGAHAHAQQGTGQHGVVRVALRVGKARAQKPLLCAAGVEQKRQALYRLEKAKAQDVGRHGPPGAGQVHKGGHQQRHVAFAEVDAGGAGVLGEPQPSRQALGIGVIHAKQPPCCAYARPLPVIAEARQLLKPAERGAGQRIGYRSAKPSPGRLGKRPQGRVRQGIDRKTRHIRRDGQRGQRGLRLAQEIHRTKQQRRVCRQRAHGGRGAYQRQPPHDLYGVVLKPVGQSRQAGFRLHSRLRKLGSAERRTVVYAGVGISVRRGLGRALHRGIDGGRKQRWSADMTQRGVEPRIPLGSEAVRAHQVQKERFIGQKGEHGFKGFLAGIKQRVALAKPLPACFRHGKAQARGPRRRRQGPLRRLRRLRGIGQRGKNHQHARSQHRAHPLCRQ